MKIRTLTMLTVVAMIAILLALTPGQARAAATTRWVNAVDPNGGGYAPPGTSCNDPGYPTIQSAVTAAVSGDTIRVCAGTYVEQVKIDKSLTLKGEDDKSVIKAPSSMLPDADGKTNIVEITGASTSVDASHLAVAGPMPVCGDSGIAIIDGAKLAINHAAVRNIGPAVPTSACVAGEGIRAGTQRNSATARVGHLVAKNVEVTGYNRSGIVIAGSGSTGDLDHNTVATGPSPSTFTLPQNGIVVGGVGVAAGAVLSADHNSVRGNHCNYIVSGQCGSDFVNDVQSGGILLYDAGSGVSLAHNELTDNDIGIYVTGGAGAGLDTNVVFDHNKANENRYVGIFFDTGATNPTVSHNDTKKNGQYGIYLGSTTGGPYGGIGGLFVDNDAKDNPTFDLWWDGQGTPTFNKNHCSTAFPSKAAWDCK